MAADLIDQLTQDPDFLSLSEADQDKMYEELSGQRTQLSPQEFTQRHPLASNPTFQTLVSRPAAQYRSAVRGLVAGKNPLEELALGATAQGEDLVSRAAPFNFRTPVQTFMSRVMPIPRTGLDIAAQTALGTAADVGATGAETVANMATNPAEAIAGLFPFSRIGKTVGGAIIASKPGQAIGKFVTTPISQLFRGKPVLTNSELLSMTEAQVAKLPATLRADYVALKSQAAKDALLPRFQQAEEVLATKGQQAQEALQLKSIEHQAALQKQRIDFQVQVAKVEQARKLQVQEVGRSAPSVARESLRDLSTKFRPLARAHSEAYVSGMNDTLATAEAVSGSPITFTQQELDQAIAQKYLRPTPAGSPLIAQEENPQAYQELTGLLRQHGIVNQQEVSARQLLNIAKGESKQVSPAAKQLLRPYTPQEVAHQHLHDILIDLLKSRGVDVSAVDAGWKAWVPVRNLGLKLQTEAGPSKLISIVRGRNPVAAEHLDSLQALLGERLDTPTRKVFEQLDSLTQQKVIEQAKAVEFERVLQSQQSAFRTGQLAEKSALRTGQRTAEEGLSEQQRVAQRGITETAMEQKRRIEQMAAHRDKIRKIIYGAALTAAAAFTPVGKRVIGGISDFLNPQ